MTRLTKNIIYNVTGQGLVLIVSLVAVRFIFRRLGDDVFGIILFNVVLTTVLSASLELGVSSTLVREVSGRHESEPDYVRTLIRTASTLYWGASTFLVVVIWITAPWLVSHWVNLKTIDTGTAATMLRLMSGTSLVALPRSLYASLFRGHQMMHLNNGIDVGAALTQQAGILLILLAGGRVYLVASWISISALMSVVAYILVVGRLVGWGALWPSFSTSVIRRNVGFTGHMVVLSILSLVHTQAAQVIVSKLLPIAEFGFYGFASSTVSRAAFVTSAAAQAAFPSFSNLHAAGERYGLIQQYRKLQDLVCYGTMPLFVGICFAALPVYSFVFSSSVAQRLLLPTVFLALGSWMNGTINMPYMLTLAMGKPQIAVRLNIYALFVVLPMTAALIITFGLPGAGFSWVFYHMFAWGYMVPRVCRECLDIPAWRWFSHALRTIGLALVTYGLAWLALAVSGSFSLFALAAAYLAGSAAFAAGAYVLIGPDLRDTLVRLRQSLTLRMARAH